MASGGLVGQRVQYIRRRDPIDAAPARADTALGKTTGQVRPVVSSVRAGPAELSGTGTSPDEKLMQVSAAHPTAKTTMIPVA